MSLEEYLDDLLAPLGGPGPNTTAHREWETTLAKWEASSSPIIPNTEEADASLFTAPYPTVYSFLSDGYNRATNQHDHRNGKAADHDHSSLSLPVPETTQWISPLPDLEAFPVPVADLSKLMSRVRGHLTQSAYASLVELLSSTQPDEAIQSELVEILGFEGEGLSLVESLLLPGTRRALVEADKGRKKGSGNGGVVNGLKPSHSHLPSPQLTVNARGKGSGKKQMIDITDVIGTNEDIERRIQEQLNRPKAMFVEEGAQRITQQEVLPHVYTSGATVSAALSQGGKLALPVGTLRDQTDTYEEVTVPPPTMVPPKRNERPVLIRSLPPLARGCFPGYTSLNRMQSVVQPTAMGTNENMLVCAPTGAGKTDVALMSIIRVLQSHVRSGPSTHGSGFNIDRDAFKVIYVAPMKALAAEITRKFGKRLAWLGIKVRELTGDMQMTRQEIAETQVIVTTPEKWDVVTRKTTGEGELAAKVRLLIIDEVHLLNEERGAVIETIVARTLRQVESSQSLIRIVGLSATLPNYIDVSDFLRVNRYQGLFFFDASFRPVPLEQHFIGVKGKPRSTMQIRNMDQVVFDKVVDLVRDGHQVMVFVHARKETVKTAQKLREMAMEEAALDFFDTRDHPKFQLYRRDVGISRNKEMKELFDSGFGIHHAGMLRSDRSMMERLFEDNCIKVLCCTSTLAWGVNLPAHAVVIKGTQVYDSSRGLFVDLSVLDVLQIFGRAGRPGYETSGVGYICTTQDKIDHYLYSIMSQQPIESKFIPGMVDALNAEISLGTIASVRDAISWIGYTYLFVRMRREPFIYGMSHDEPKDDPQLGNKRSELVTQAARQLAAAKMIRFDELNNSFIISDLGRIAARYYLRHQTVEVFNQQFNPKMRNADIFAMLSQATEFAQIQVRDNEIDELTTIMSSDNCPMEVKGGATTSHGKVNILLQAHISKVYLEDFALVSDAGYVAQNAGRIIRALLEISLSRNWANCASLLIDLSKAIERRMWPYEHPLAQIPTLHRDTLFNLRRWADDTEISELRVMDPLELGTLVHLNENHGSALRNAALMFPSVGVEYSLRPLAHDLLQISVKVERQFQWSTKLSGSAEPFYVWVQDEEGLHILQWRTILLRQTSTAVDIDFVVPWTGDGPSTLTIITASDKWLGSDSQTTVSLVNLVMPAAFKDRTPLIDIPYLSITAVDDPDLETLYRPHVTMLNGIQSQAFWSIYHTHNNVLVSAPVASGKSLLGEMAIWHTFKHDHSAIALIIVPHARTASETTARIRSVTPRSRKISISTALSSKGLESALENRDGSGRIIVAIPGAFDDYVHSRLEALGSQISLIVLEDTHLLDPAYELAIAKLLLIAKPARTRIVALTCSLTDPSDLGTWLGVEQAYRFSFYPTDRGSPLVVQMKTFSTAHSATLLKTMVKPTYDIVKAMTSVIIFVPSRAACRFVASDLVTQSGTEMDLNGFLAMPRADVEPLVANLKDQSLFEPVLHGIGYYIPGMSPADLRTTLELFASGIIRALIVPRDTCWTLPVRAQAVILMGAQYTTPGGPGTDRQIINYSRHELVRMQGFAALSAHPTASGGKMFIMCQAEQQTAIARVLSDGLPLESSLQDVLARTDMHNTPTLERMLISREPPPPPQINRPRFPDLRKRDLMDLIGWTLLEARIQHNPTYYDMMDGLQANQLSRLVDKFFVRQPTKVKAAKVTIQLDPNESSGRATPLSDFDDRNPNDDTGDQTPAENAPAPTTLAAFNMFEVEEVDDFDEEEVGNKSE